MSKSYQVDFHQEVAEKTRGKFLDAVFKWRQVYRQCPVLIETVVSSHLGFRFDWWREDVQKEAIKKWFQKCCGGVLSAGGNDLFSVPDPRNRVVVTCGPPRGSLLGVASGS